MKWVSPVLRDGVLLFDSSLSSCGSTCWGNEGSSYALEGSPPSSVGEISPIPSPPSPSFFLTRSHCLALPSLDYVE